MKSKQRIKLSSRITAMLMSCAVVFALMLVIGIGSADKAYAAESGKAYGIDYRITDSNVLELGSSNPNETQVLYRPYQPVDAGLTSEQETNPYQGNTEDADSIYFARREEWPWLRDGKDDTITAVNIIGNIKVIGSMTYMFCGLSNATTISGLEKMDVSDATTMNGLFGWQLPSMKNPDACSKIAHLDLKTWNTGNVTLMNYMFIGCSSLKTVEGIENFKTDNVIRMSQMFDGCSSFTFSDEDKNVSGWKVDKVADMAGMFRDCKLITKLDLSNWNSSKVEDMNSMFNGCSGLTTLTFGENGLKTGRVTSMHYMFRNCSALTELNVKHFDTGKVKNMGGMFVGCELLNNLDVSGWNTGNVDDMQQMFNGCQGLTGLDMSGWDTRGVKETKAMFNECRALGEIIGLDKLNISNVTDADVMFRNCLALNNPAVLGLDMSNLVSANRMISECQKLGEGLQAEITARENAIRLAGVTAGKSDDEINSEIAGDAAINNLKQVKGTVEYMIKGKNTNGDVFKDDAEAMQAFKDVSKLYSTAMIEKAKQDATDAIATAKTVVETALNNPDDQIKQQEAIDALKAAQRAVDKAMGLANNTGETDETDAVAALQTQLIGEDNNQRPRELLKLTEELAVAKAINRSNYSRASARTLKDAIANAETVSIDSGATAVDINKARKVLADAVAGLESKSDIEKAADALGEARKKAAKAKDDADKAKEKAEKLAAENPGSDEAIKAAEAAVKAAEEAQKAADEVTKAAEARVDYRAAAEAAAAKGNADTASAEAAVAYAEQLDKAVEKETDPVKKAELANKAAEAWNDAAGKAEATGNTELNNKANEAKAKAEKAAQTASDTALNTAIADGKKVDTSNATPESKKALEDAIANAEKVLADPASTPEQKLAAAKAVTDAIKNLKSLDSKVGQEITVARNVYVITKDPGATWDGEVSLKTAKNAKNVSVPKVVKHEGKSYEVNRVQAGAFRAKKIRKVTLGANVAKLDAKAFNKSKATTIVLKTKDLTKKSVKGALKGSKVKTVQVKVGSKKVNKKFVKKYKKIFNKKNAGKKVTVK